MAKKRIFIAVNFPAKLKARLLDLQREWPDLPIRWTAEDNLHLTLVFIGYATNDELAEICKIAGTVAKNHAPFELTFKRVIYGPPSSARETGLPNSRTRMIWVEGERNEALARLKNDLGDALLASPRSGFYHKESRDFKPHLTLGRFNEMEWRDFSPKPKIDLEFDAVIGVGTIEVMESELKKGGAEYAILESIPFGGET